MKKLPFLCFVINLILLLSSVQAQVHLDSQGNVGIGTNTPMSRLHVYSTSGTAMILQGDDGWIGLNLYDGDTNQVAGMGFLNVGNGINSLDYFNIKSGGMGMLSFYIFDPSLSWPQPAKMVIKNSGNVGIGTASPNEKLDVEGNLDMNQNQIKNMVIENRTDNPANPVVGQIWIRTDL
jgi:hypothetical protein